MISRLSLLIAFMAATAPSAQGVECSTFTKLKAPHKRFNLNTARQLEMELAVALKYRMLLQAKTTKVPYMGESPGETILGILGISEPLKLTSRLRHSKAHRENLSDIIRGLTDSKIEALTLELYGGFINYHSKRTNGSSNRFTRNKVARPREPVFRSKLIEDILNAGLEKELESFVRANIPNIAANALNMIILMPKGWHIEKAVATCVGAACAVLAVGEPSGAAVAASMFGFLVSDRILQQKPQIFNFKSYLDVEQYE